MCLDLEFQPHFGCKGYLKINVSKKKLGEAGQKVLEGFVEKVRDLGLLRGTWSLAVERDKQTPVSGGSLWGDGKGVKQGGPLGQPGRERSLEKAGEEKGDDGKDRGGTEGCVPRPGGPGRG